MLKKVQLQNKKLMMVGNGGSASICSHMAVDYWKNGNIKSTAFNDSSLLTTVSNDYSFAEVFSKTIEMFGEEGDMLYCISSSGKSVNILNAANEALKKKCNVITFSGFSGDNPLRKKEFTFKKNWILKRGFLLLIWRKLFLILQKKFQIILSSKEHRTL